MDANGVAAVRAVQTVSFYGYDNRYLADVCRAIPAGSAGCAPWIPTIPEVP